MDQRWIVNTVDGGHVCSNPGYRGLIKQLAQGHIKFKIPTQSGRKLGGQQGVAACGKEIVMNTRVGDTQQFSPEGGDLLLQSLKLAQELQDLVGQSNVLEAMGTHLAERGRTEAALEAFTKCLELRKETGFVKGAERVRSLLEAAVKAHPLETDVACSTPVSRAPGARDPQ